MGAVSITSPLLDARKLGMLGLVMFWQEFYGTCVYFFQYFFNGRFRRSPRAHTLGIVVPANGIWMALPALGMWASARLVLDGSYAALATPHRASEPGFPVTLVHLLQTHVVRQK